MYDPKAMVIECLNKGMPVERIVIRLELPFEYVYNIAYDIGGARG